MLSPKSAVLAVVGLLLTGLMLAPSAALAQAQGVRGEASITTTGGYGRIVIRTAADVESQVRMTSGILVIQFRQPVNVAVDRLGTGASEYIGAARRDPDGRALRFALTQKVKVSSMVAGERLFVDLLPESWTGEPPGLPREVVEELAKRANEADRLARQKRAAEEQKKIPPVRVRVAAQPTFTRYIFELPELTGVTAERGKDKLTLTFAKSLRFDLSDAKLAAAKAVTAVDAGGSGDNPEVQFKFSQQADVRTFREDSNYVVDVSPIDAKAPAAVATGPLAGATTPETIVAIEPKLPESKPSESKSSDAQPSESKEPESKVSESRKPGVAPTTAPPAAAMPRVAADEAEPPAPAGKEPATPARAAKPDPRRPVITELRRQGDNLRLFFPFSVPTPAAVFQRADALWLVFDTEAALDVSVLSNDQSKTIRSAAVAREDDAQVVRLKLERPRLVSVEPQDSGWLVTVGDALAGATKPLVVARNIVGPGRTSITIPFDEPQKAHWLDDADVGDRLVVVTGLGPTRGLIKGQDFVDFRALGSAQGIALQPFADDIKAELSADKIILTRPSGLTLSDAAAAQQEKAARAVIFDTKRWNDDRQAEYARRQFELVRAAAEAPVTGRTEARLDLARFYFSRQMYSEAKSVLDTAIADERPTAEDPSPLVLRAVANIMLGRLEAAQRDLANPAVGNQNDAPLWRALTLARQAKWPEAVDAFRNVEGALSALPLELQRIALKEAMRAAIEVGDFPTAVRRLNDFKIIGQSAEIEPTLSVLAGRLAEAVGRSHDALAAYRFAAASSDRPAAAQGRLREIALRYSLGDTKKADYVGELENLTTAWRGDETEVEALQTLARLYTEQDNYREAFHVMRVALTAYPNSPLTRNIQSEAAKTFDALFLAGKGDALPAIDALGLFYDFRDLTPIGRRGDEMIRRLAERLVSVDLLDQGAELLQYQVDNRLQGAARAQVATRLAVIYLMNHKPANAQAVLRATRTADLSNEIRVPRLMIEARALSDLGRNDFALEVISSLEGRESLRLRSDIYWASRNWQKAAEHIELLYGDRWKSFEPLSDVERADMLRIGVGYALAEDKLGAARLRDKYAAKMAEGPDGRAFDVVTGGLGSNSPEFREVARLVAGGDTLSGFLRDLKARYPEMHGVMPEAAGQGANAPKAKADPEPTGSIRQKAPRRVSAR
jgi:tetratricopeptide (TPR) repeat protein